MFNKAVLRNLSYGVYVVSSFDKENNPKGCVANSAMQLTYNTICVSLNHENYTNNVIKENGIFSLSILPEKVKPNLIAVFGFTSSKDVNKFKDFEYENIDNAPVLKDSLGYLVLKTVQAVELETHTLFIAEIISGDNLNNETPMTYKFYHEQLKGNAPKKAPTYIEPDELKQEQAKASPITDKKMFRCKICGYVYNGDITKEVPNFVCPVCKQPLSAFEEIATV